MVNVLQNGCMCVLKDIVDVKVLLGESYQHHIIPVLSNSAENSIYGRTDVSRLAIFNPL